jgi:hypothetical protein
MTACRQTACRYCGLDIEAFAPYRVGTWRDRGNNWMCDKAPLRVGTLRVHAPMRAIDARGGRR